MSNPTKQPEDPYVDRTLSTFWHAGEGSLHDGNYNQQAWGGRLNDAYCRPRISEHSVNIRSGEDEWLPTVLNECREGNLSESNCNFLHGLPTAAPMAFWHHRRKEAREWHAA